MKKTEKYKIGDWILVRAGVFKPEPMLLEVIDESPAVGDYYVSELDSYGNQFSAPFVFNSIIGGFDYAIVVPKSINIEMLELLYMPKKGALDEET